MRSTGERLGRDSWPAKLGRPAIASLTLDCALLGDTAIKGSSMRHWHVRLHKQCAGRLSLQLRVCATCFYKDVPYVRFFLKTYQTPGGT